MTLSSFDVKALYPTLFTLLAIGIIIVFIDSIKRRSEMKERTIKSVYQDNRKYGEGKIKSFLGACDDKFTGNKAYDFYWEHIWCNVCKPYEFARNKHLDRRANKERVKEGISERDTWDLCDHLVDITYKGVKHILRFEYGENWEHLDLDKTEFCETHNKQYYLDVMRFVESYRNMQYIELIFDNETETNIETIKMLDKARTKTYKEFKNIIKKYLEILWD